MEISQNISRTLLMYVFRLINRTENAALLLDLGRRMEVALSYIDKNYKQQITLDELAEKCFTNKYYLSHLFTRVQGVSIGKYIIDKRIMESKRLLDENKLSVADVAASVGFHDPSYYCRVFKKETGLTPSDYRKRLKKSSTHKGSFLENEPFFVEAENKTIKFFYEQRHAADKLRHELLFYQIRNVKNHLVFFVKFAVRMEMA